MHKVNINTTRKRQVIDITDFIQKEIEGSKEENGAVLVFVTHTTAAVTTADLDPGTDQDYLNAFDKLIPNIKFNHPHDPSHMPDHILAALIGPSLTIPFENKRLVLGTWQRTILLEFDGPKERNLMIKVI